MSWRYKNYYWNIHINLEFNTAAPLKANDDNNDNDSSRDNNSNKNSDNDNNNDKSCNIYIWFKL